MDQNKKIIISIIALTLVFSVIFFVFMVSSYIPPARPMNPVPEKNEKTEELTNIIIKVNRTNGNIPLSGLKCNLMENINDSTMQNIQNQVQITDANGFCRFFNLSISKNYVVVITNDSMINFKKIATVRKLEAGQDHEQIVYVSESDLGINTAPVSQACIDLDGQDFYIKGIAEFQGQTLIDTCSQDNQIVLERYCNSGMIASAYRQCPKGCRDGACVK